MLDDRLDDQLRDAAQDYNKPPEPPRDDSIEMLDAEQSWINRELPELVEKGWR